MSTTVKLSQETLSLLKVASTINNSIKIQAGNEIKTVATSGAVIMEAVINETFPETFSIYELNRFLSVLALPNMKDADLIFDNKNYVELKSGKASVKYKFTSGDFVTHPGRTLTLPSVDLTVDLTSEDIESLRKMAAVLGHKILEFRVDGGKSYLTTTSADLTEDTSNDSLIELADVPGSADGSYKIKFDNLILPSGDYRAEISKNGISKFSHKTQKISTFIGIERT